MFVLVAGEDNERQSGGPHQPGRPKHSVHVPQHHHRTRTSIPARTSQVASSSVCLPPNNCGRVCCCIYEKRKQEHCISTVGSEINQYTGMSMGCRVSFINQFFLAIWDKIGFVNITQLPFSKSSIRLLIVSVQYEPSLTTHCKCLFV